MSAGTMLSRVDTEAGVGEEGMENDEGGFSNDFGRIGLSCRFFHL